MYDLNDPYFYSSPDDDLTDEEIQDLEDAATDAALDEYFENQQQ